MQKNYDITILGGGMVGLMLANLLLDLPLRIAIVDPQLPETQWRADDYPLRVSAINEASRQLFEQLRLWQSLASETAVCDKMCVWDEHSNGEITFDATELGVDYLGAIVPNRLMRKVLWENCQNSNNVTFFCPSGTKQFLDAGQYRLLILEDGTRLQTHLVVGADGKRSWLRGQLGIAMQQGFYDQQGIVAVVEHEKPHQNTAYQRFLMTGPLAFLPLSLKNKGQYVSSIVWSCETDKAEQLLALNENAFNQSLTQAIDNQLGAVNLLSQRASFPLAYHHAKTYVAPGVALIGDAAHGIHPLAGQGVNLGYADAQALANLIQDASLSRQSISDVHTLKHYERQRRLHNAVTLQAMTGFDQLFSNDRASLSQLRGIGLTVANKLPLVKRVFTAISNGSLNN